MMRNSKRFAALGISICILIGAGIPGKVYAQEQMEEAAEFRTENEETAEDEGSSLLDIPILSEMEEETETKAGLVGDGETAETEVELKAYNTGTQVVNFNTKGNAVTKYIEAAGGNEGYTNGAYGADAAFLGLEDGKVKFMLSGVIGLVDASEVQVVDKAEAKSISYYYAKDGWLYHRITWDMSGDGYAAALKMGKAPEYLSEGANYYGYDGHYFYFDYSVMAADYQNGTREHAVNPANPYFNYFQYLPMRSTSRYYAKELDAVVSKKLAQNNRENSKLKGIGETLIKNQDTYGVNALLMLGMAINESAWGTSKICQEKNNLFGLNAVDTTPYESANYFPSVDACVKEFAQFWISKGYLNPSDYRYNGGFLGNKASGLNVKYSSAPYMGETVAAIIWNLEPDLGNLDQYAYTLAVKNLLPQNADQVYMRAGVSSTAAILYQSSPRSCMSFLVMSEERKNGFYKIQSDALLKEDKTSVDSNSDGSYNFNHMYVYSGADYVTVVNNGTASGISHFRDVTSDGWYYSVVKSAYENEVMTGMNLREFGITAQLARAHFATILYRLEGSPDVSYRNVYKDVPSNVFYASAAMWGKENNIITGYSDTGLFGGSDAVTREQMATILYRYANYKGYSTAARADLGSFPDAGSVSGYAREAMQWAVASGLIAGDNGMLKPQGTAIRAESAAIIVRFMNKYHQ